MVALFGVRRGHHMRDAVRRCQPAHFDRNFPGFGPIVDFRQDVSVDINHAVERGATYCPNLSRFGAKDQTRLEPDARRFCDPRIDCWEISSLGYPEPTQINSVRLPDTHR